MSFSIYIHRESRIHRLSAGRKLAALACAGTVVSFTADIPALAVTTLICLALYYLAGLDWKVFYRQLRPLFWIMVLLFAVKALTGPLPEAIVMVLRLSALVAGASLVTLSTKTEDMLETLEWGLQPFKRFGVSPAKVAFALSLVIRFIPIVGQMSAEVREAQQARGLGNNFFALTIPLVIRIIKMADNVAEAIDVRGGLPEDDTDKEDDYVAISLNTKGLAAKSLTLPELRQEH